MSVDLRLRHDRLLREQAVEMFERGCGYGLTAKRLGVCRDCERVAEDVPRDREGRASYHGSKAGQIRL